VLTIVVGESRIRPDDSSLEAVMIAATWAALPQRFPTLALDAFVVLPNHIHGILVLTE